MGAEVERRKTILRAAIRALAKKGYPGCRISDVAREAGVAYGLVYHYFKSKDELLQAVFDAVWADFLGRVEAVASSARPLETKIREIVDFAFDSYRSDARTVKVLILEIARSPAGDAVNRRSAFVRLVAVVEKMLRRAQLDGELREDVDPGLMSSLLFGALEMGLTSLVLGLVDSERPGAVEAAKGQLASVFLNGVTPRSGGALTWKTDRSATRSRVREPS